MILIELIYLYIVFVYNTNMYTVVEYIAVITQQFNDSHGYHFEQLQFNAHRQLTEQCLSGRVLQMCACVKINLLQSSPQK